MAENSLPLSVVMVFRHLRYANSILTTVFDNGVSSFRKAVFPSSRSRSLVRAAQGWRVRGRRRQDPYQSHRSVCRLPRSACRVCLCGLICWWPSPHIENKYSARNMQIKKTECNSLSYTPFCYRWLVDLFHFFEVDVGHLVVAALRLSAGILSPNSPSCFSVWNTIASA